LAGVLLLAILASSTGHAHTPYGQWVVYRQKHLVVGSHRLEPATFELARNIKVVLDEQLPKASSRVARASLLGTGQLDYAVLRVDEAYDMRAGWGQFAAYGPIAIRQLLATQSLVFVAHERVPVDHAGLVVASLLERSAVFPREQNLAPALGWHAGALEALHASPLQLRAD
jgi:hypothetical protein